MYQVNTKLIAEIADRNPTAEAFFTYAACRHRNVREGVSKLPVIRAQMAKEGFTPVPQDLLTVFRELERAGVGELKDDSFKWNIPIKKVGEAATDSGKFSDIKPVKASPQDAKKTLVMCFSSNKEACITYPSNLTKEEATFLYNRLLQECKS